MALEARHLSVRHGDGLALEDISFRLDPGTLTALVGPPAGPGASWP